MLLCWCNLPGCSPIQTRFVSTKYQVNRSYFFIPCSSVRFSVFAILQGPGIPPLQHEGHTYSKVNVLLLFCQLKLSNYTYLGTCLKQKIVLLVVNVMAWFIFDYSEKLAQIGHENMNSVQNSSFMFSIPHEAISQGLFIVLT